MDENQSELEKKERRRSRRFSDLTLLYIPLHLQSLSEDSGQSLNGNLINMSPHGLDFQTSQSVFPGSKYHLSLVLPDRSRLESDVEVTRFEPKDKLYIVGVKFLTLPDYMAKKINKVANDYNDCEERIEKDADEICFLDCSFYTMCQKTQKKKL